MRYIVVDNCNDSNDVLRLTLRETADGSVEVAAVDKNGVMRSQGHLLKFTSDGRLFLYASVNEDFGLQLDGDGRIELASCE